MLPSRTNIQKYIVSVVAQIELALGCTLLFRDCLMSGAVAATELPTRLHTAHHRKLVSSYFLA